jgi:pimeloyl-ACP methyl ester carboxylesterase
MDHSWLRRSQGWLAGSALAIGLLWADAGLAEDAAARMQRWGASQCSSMAALKDYELPEGFYCLELPAPVPSASSPTMIRFAIHPAEGAPADRLGALLTMVGGPGEVGLADAPSYLDGLPDQVRKSFDLVWLNQRGIDPDHHVQCPNAQRSFTSARRALPYPLDSQAKFDRLAQAVKTYVGLCTQEIGNQQLLPFMSTEQAVEDVELFRNATQEPQVYLYGQSYGTQFGQTYVRKHEAAAKRLILDGVVDMELSGTEYFERQTKAFSEVVRATLQGCANDGACQKDFGTKDPVDFYGSLVSILAQGPIQVQFPVPAVGPKGRLLQKVVPRRLYAADLEMLAYGQVYSPSQRADFLRWLAAAAQGDFVPLLRAAYSQWPLDPKNEEPVGNANDAPYYSVECSDYAYPDGAQGFFTLEKKLIDQGLELASAALIDLPCAFWTPGTPPNPTRPDAFKPELPVLLLNGTLDPATPVAGVRRMIGPLGENGRKVELQNAGHVILDMGNPCVVTRANSFLQGSMPDGTTCSTDVVSGYLPLLRDRPDIVAGYDLEISSLPEYRGWDRDGEPELLVGCTRGGTARFQSTKDVNGNSDESWSLNQCSFVEGVRLTARGKLHHDEQQNSDVLKLTVWQPRKHPRNYKRCGAFDLEKLPVPGSVCWVGRDLGLKNQGLFSCDLCTGTQASGPKKRNTALRRKLRPAALVLR